MYIETGFVTALNNRTCNKLGLTISHDTIRPNPYYRYEENPIILNSSVEVHTVEVKGHQRYPEQQADDEKSGIYAWVPQPHLKVESMTIHYDYEEKMIWTKYDSQEETAHTLRSSWEDKHQYIHHHAKGIRYFDTRQEMAVVKNRLSQELNPYLLKEKTEVHPESDTKGCVRCYFSSPVSFTEVCELAGMRVTGEYTHV